jgi:hypothetical protein
MMFDLHRHGRFLRLLPLWIVTVMVVTACGGTPAAQQGATAAPAPAAEATAAPAAPAAEATTAPAAPAAEATAAPAEEPAAGSGELLTASFEQQAT